MGLKDRIFIDNANVFLNLDHFAELLAVYYNGKILENVPAMLDAQVENKRDRAQNDYIQGLSVVTHTLFCETKVFDGQLPQPEEKIELQDEKGRLTKYYVVSCKDDLGMCKIQLRETRG